jgi:hypothetical protein
MRVALGAVHHYASRTKHTWTDFQGRHEFAPFFRVEIAQHPGESSCYLFRFSEDNRIADTWHETMGDALNQAEWEFGVRADEWQTVKQENPA